MIKEECYFCFDKVPKSNPQPRKLYASGKIDLTGVPINLAEDINQNLKNGFPVCSRCLPFLQKGEFDELFRSLTRQLELELNKTNLTSADASAVYSLLATLSLKNQVYRNSVTQGSRKLMNCLEPAFCLLFDILSASKSKLNLAKFENGVELYLYPSNDRVMIVDFRSGNRQRGHAGRVLQLLTAYADLHQVQLRGTVEAHAFDKAADILDEVELLKWYQRRGFERTGELQGHATVVRAPKQVPFIEAQAAVRKALSSINPGE